MVKKGYTVKQLFQIIFSASKKQICTKKPVGVRSFASYVIDLTKVHLPDLTADDNGIWRVSMPRRTYKVTLVDDTVIDSTEVQNPADDEENVHTPIWYACRYTRIPQDNYYHCQ